MPNRRSSRSTKSGRKRTKRKPRQVDDTPRSSDIHKCARLNTRISQNVIDDQDDNVDDADQNKDVFIDLTQTDSPIIERNQAIISQSVKHMRGRSNQPGDVDRKSDIVNSYLDPEINKTFFENYEELVTSYFPNEAPFNSPLNLCMREVSKASSESAKFGWQRAMKKFSNDTIFYSPIKYHVRNLKPIYFQDKYTENLTMILGTSEMFYYNNAILMSNQYRDDKVRFANFLRNAFNEIDFNELAQRWVNVTKLGEGSYGVVLRVTDSTTNTDYAVKHIKPFIRSDFTAQLFKTFEYIRERNALIKGGKSPFIVQFQLGLRSHIHDSTFLVFEHCVMDLARLLTIFRQSFWHPHHHKLVYQFNKRPGDSLHSVLESIQKSFKCNMYIVLQIYIFELFCISEALASYHLVHNDIKPANILITINGHLKVADFGLVYNTSYITDQCGLHSVKYSDIPNKTPITPHHNLCTVMYYDLELLYHNQYNVLNQPLNSKLTIRFDQNDYEQNYLSDAWSLNYIMSEIVLLGINMFNVENMSYSYRNQLETLVGGLNFSNLVIPQVTFVIMGNKHAFAEHTTNFKIFTETLWGYIPSLIIEGFYPRFKRFRNYRSICKFDAYEKRSEHLCIDMSKIENIPVFKNNNFTSTTIVTYKMPGNYVYWLRESRTGSDFRNFQDYLNSRRRYPKKFYDVSSSVNINLL